MQTTLVVLLTSVVVGLTALRVWGHDGNTDPNVIHACVLPSGLIRVVAPAGNCLNNEAPIHLAPASAPNVAQVTGNSPVGCPTPQGNFETIPDFSVQLTTTGKPVMIMFTLFFVASPTGIISMRPAIEGIGIDPSAVYALGQGPINEGQHLTLSYSRVHALSAGTHTFGIEVTCQDAVTIYPNVSWLTVYELK